MLVTDSAVLLCGHDAKQERELQGEPSEPAGATASAAISCRKASRPSVVALLGAIPDDHHAELSSIRGVARSTLELDRHAASDRRIHRSNLIRWSAVVVQVEGQHQKDRFA